MPINSYLRGAIQICVCVFEKCCTMFLHKNFVWNWRTNGTKKITLKETVTSVGAIWRTHIKRIVMSHSLPEDVRLRRVQRWWTDYTNGRCQKDILFGALGYSRLPPRRRFVNISCHLCKIEVRRRRSFGLFCCVFSYTSYVRHRALLD